MTLSACLQFIDDVLDFTSSSGQLGKPNLNDIKSGVITAPVLYAAEQHPELIDMIQRKFKNDGDVSRANALVYDSNGIEQTRDLAAEHCRLAAQTVCAADTLLWFCYQDVMYFALCVLLTLPFVCRSNTFLRPRVPMRRSVVKPCWKSQTRFCVDPSECIYGDCGHVQLCNTLRFAYNTQASSIEVQMCATLTISLVHYASAGCR